MGLAVWAVLLLPRRPVGRYSALGWEVQGQAGLQRAWLDDEERAGTMGKVELPGCKTRGACRGG